MVVAGEIGDWDGGSTGGSATASVSQPWFLKAVFWRKPWWFSSEKKWIVYVVLIIVYIYIGRLTHDGSKAMIRLVLLDVQKQQFHWCINNIIIFMCRSYIYEGINNQPEWRYNHVSMGIQRDIWSSYTSCITCISCPDVVQLFNHQLLGILEDLSKNKSGNHKQQ